MKAYSGSKVQLHAFFTSVLDGGEWSTSCPSHFNPEEEPWCKLNMKLDGPQSQPGRFREETNLLPLPGIEPQFLYKAELL
jgi:hypothetical protein